MPRTARPSLIVLCWLLVTVFSLSYSHRRVVVRAAPPPKPSSAAPAVVGIFEDHADVGNVLHPGSTEYDASNGSYTIRGSGENVWFAKDEFQFAWKKMSGDVAFSADISFVGAGKNPHRKALLMIRQGLDTDSVYADIALHGVGMTALQFRDEKGGPTREVQANISSPKHLRIEKRGNYFHMWLAADDGSWQMSAGSPKVSLEGSFYVGIGVCSHEKDLSETAVFSNVKLTSLGTMATDAIDIYSTLEVVTIASSDRSVIYAVPHRIEAPNWSRDGSTLLFNRNGHLERIPVTGGTPQMIDTGFANRINNDHGISPDGKSLVISDQSQEPHKSLIYILPFAGGTPHRVTQNSPSYWHGWSPDGKTLAFVGERNGDFDIYSIPVSGGDETRLTTAKGLDDGPEYSPDGNYIYFNSERAGKMDIYRMRPDGSQQESVLSDDYNNWFPHISPDGTRMVVLSYEKDVKGHPENKDVMLRLISLKDTKITVLAKLFGGQGTINVPSWSPDGTKLAFVSYTLAFK